MQIEGLGQHTSLVNQYCLEAIAPPTSDELENHDEKASSSATFTSTKVQMELSMGDINNMEQNLPVFESENKSLKEEIISMIPVGIGRLKQDKEMVLLLTGIPNYLLLMPLLSLRSESVSRKYRNCLTAFQEFLLSMMKLRLNLPFQGLAYRFNTSNSTGLRIIDKWIDVTATAITILIMWPNTEEFQKTMSTSFVQVYGHKVVVIIDCFEVFIERPGVLLDRASTWSNYTHHNTIKFLIGICPQRVISCISKAWDGRTTDKFLTKNCHILSRLFQVILFLQIGTSTSVKG